MTDRIQFEAVQPIAALEPLVESFWRLANETDDNKPAVILPDGRLDVSFTSRNHQRILLHGLETQPSQVEIAPRFSMFCISFRPLAAEYLFKSFLPIVPDSISLLPANYFNDTLNDFENIGEFSGLLTEVLSKMLTADIDPRKKRLFDLIYSSHGGMSVRALSENVGWSARQMNRYFQDTFGMSLKTYCSVLRFRSSFGHIKSGKLFPKENYADQSHFIRDIRKFAGVVPKELAKNTNDRFIQFSTLPPN